MAAAASTATPPPLKQLSEDVSRPPAVATVLAVSLRDTLRVSTLFGLLMVLWHPIYTSLVTALQTWWPMSNIALFVVGTMVVHESMYYGFNALLLAARQDPRLAAYHLPRLSHQEPSTALIWKTLRASFVGHWLIQPLTGWAIYHLFVDRGMRFDGPGPAVHVAAAQMAISLLLNDAVFYWAHRLLHHPKLYARFHKQHHEYKGPVGFAAEYAGTLEQFLSNQLPVVLGPLLVGMHCSTWWLYLTWRLWRTYEIHSGLMLQNTWLGRLGLLHGHGAVYHDFHHTNNHGNFGGPANALWDVLGGTEDPAFRVYCQRHNIRSYHHLD
ncbi:uncharacterized protein MONBRDRAFT_27469 [Monosiga brevicollis MX1]|uniref:Fatty acid hydroxylase domain-containing protein n=1 Tax=Monosiga brevicollis TaxID=81824 RepID=A9V5D0_MONBE|nr:uncharacterized protein MONBRDRAFT_27469 [Monosiga brevicollis MX1]EDQ87352.1 predicted protein [Monosiga brevicollis MX1]|eukprot:XP_001747965.1 hypothetical protein [Monosiga brevicollis MX1]